MRQHASKACEANDEAKLVAARRREGRVSRDLRWCSSMEPEVGMPPVEVRGGDPRLLVQG